MKKEFSKHWNSSKQPRKQRKYLANAPLHIRNKFVSAHLSKELREKHSTRSIRARVGDKVKIMRGQFKKKTGKIERINSKENKVYVSGIDFTKKDGSKAFYPIHPSKLLVTEINMSDKRRLSNKEGKKEKTEIKDTKSIKEEHQKSDAEK